jgi:threonine-phosphate decarboxylase
MRGTKGVEISRPVHGADIVAAARQHGLAPERLLDFSSNVNPDGPPPRVRRFLSRVVRDPWLLRGYPDDSHGDLRAALGSLWRVPAGTVVVGNGTSALVHDVVRVLTPRTCLVPEPAFSEYAHALRNGGVRTIAFPLRAADDFRLDVHAFAKTLRRLRVPLAIVNNPHNPTGAFIPRHEVAALFGAAGRAGTVLLLDEAFIEYAGAGASQVAAAAKGAPVVVLRSLTKLYGMAGLRVGAAVASAPLAGRLRAALPSWPVGALAARAAVEAVRDERFAAQVLARNARARRMLARGLASLGCRVFPSAANFLLLRLPEGASHARELRERLVAEYGILVRDASCYAGLGAGCFLRVAVRRPVENRRLVTALRHVLRPGSRC